MTTAARPQGNFRPKAPPGPLTVPERHALLEGWLARHPNPVALLVARHGRLVRVARECGFDADEVNAACLAGAVRAARVFDPRRGFKFWTIALYYMRAEVCDLVRQAGRDATRLGGRRVASLDAGLEGDDDATLAAAVADDRRPGPSDRAEGADELARVRAAVARLPARMRAVVRLRWGLGGAAARTPTLRQVGDRLGVSKERVRQIEAAAVERLRDELREGDR
jgi:RNA polymerase sigma factor (sigma-70 family)